jgi:3-isopropylmalate/(R)-2-methylmalate dehydratase small subunit
MRTFATVAGPAVAMLRDNIDTDAIIPVPYMLAGMRPDYGRGLFGNWRYARGFEERPDFVLNRPEYRQAKLLIAGANFGCGSSREMAVWALDGFGFRCVVAPSFGEIFFNNCFKSGFLPVVLPAEQVARLAAEAERVAGREAFTVDLVGQVVAAPSGELARFEIDAERKTMLLEGLDEIALTLRDEAAIAEFQRRDRAQRPWVYEAGLAP